ncbi:MAG TPA: MBL fold metallo-hydrolase [Aggregatilineales bacterium]|nr:MBL fold metallo-hydrolase [Aggregatilineales bacterium]
MEISWYGHSCFRLADRGKATIVTDPYDETIGYDVPKLKADVATISHDAPGHSSVDSVKNIQRVINGPGEYEIGGVFILGAAMHNLEADPPKRNVSYKFDFDGLSIVHLGDLDHVPAQSTIEAMGAVDIALVPVGGGGALNATQAAEVIGLLEPSLVIPMHYKTEESRLDLEGVDRFLKEMGVSRIQQESLLKVSKSNLPEQTQIVVLECTR